MRSMAKAEGATRDQCIRAPLVQSTAKRNPCWVLHQAWLAPLPRTRLRASCIAGLCPDMPSALALLTTDDLSPRHGRPCLGLLGSSNTGSPLPRVHKETWSRLQATGISCRFSITAKRAGAGGCVLPMSHHAPPRHMPHLTSP